MTCRFIHTADWQLGKPFARVEDPHKRALLQNERIECIERIGKAALEHQAQFILVAGDLFDSRTASKSMVAAACAAIGQLELPVLVIPGNHDHGGPGCVWEQRFFLEERDRLAPNLRVLLRPEPVELENAWVFACPLLRNQESADTTAWLRSPEAVAGCDPDKPRIALAHGSIQGFGSSQGDEEEGASGANLVEIDRLPEGAFDYVALGDWHGAKQITPFAWYSGTPEPDRFAKGDDYQSGKVLAVVAARGQTPQVTPMATGRLEWSRRSFAFSEDATLEIFKQQMASLLGARANQDLLHLELRGSLGMEAAGELENELESLKARLLRVKLSYQVTIAPTEDEIAQLTRRQGDPLISLVAAQLAEQARGTDESGAVARVALRELFAACQSV